MKADTLSDPQLSRRYRQYLLFRLLVVVLSLGLVTFNQVWTDMIFREYAGFYLHGLLLMYLAFSIVACLFCEHAKQRRGRIRVEVAVDFAVQSSLVWFTGGIFSIFTPLLFVTLVAATGLVPTRDSRVIACFVALSLTFTTVAYAIGVVPVTSQTMANVLGKQYTTYAGPYLVGCVIGLFAVSGLGSAYSRGLRRIEGLQSAILENIAEGLIATDPQGNVLRLNREARHLLHLDTVDTEYNGRPLDQVIKSRSAAVILEALSKDQNHNFKIRVPDGNGGEKPLEVKISFVGDEDGQTRCRIALLDDLTLQHEIEVAEQRIQKLEDLHVMALGIAHEIRNPLASIRGCAQEIRRMTGCTALERRFMDIICRESDRLDKTLEEFMTYARKDPVRRSPLNVVEVLDEAVFLIKARGEFGNRQLEWQGHPRAVNILGNRTQLVQVLLNLGLNAIDATDPERGRIWIRLRESQLWQRRGSAAGDERIAGVEIECGDNGIGFDADQQDQLFAPFFTTKENGNGLGLAIAQRIVGEHEGLIDVSSTPGEGTVFRLQLPLLGARAAVEPAPESQRDKDPVEQSCHA